MACLLLLACIELFLASSQLASGSKDTCQKHMSMCIMSATCNAKDYTICCCSVRNGRWLLAQLLGHLVDRSRFQQGLAEASELYIRR